MPDRVVPRNSRDGKAFSYDGEEKGRGAECQKNEVGEMEGGGRLAEKAEDVLGVEEREGHRREREDG